MTSEFGIEVPEHTLLSRLRGGGMASVFLAREERLGRLVALKVIDDRFQEDDQFRRRFEREARTAAGLTHPNIVPIFQYGFTSDARPYLSMPFLEDGSLRDRLRKRGALPVDEALAIARQIASALVAAHSRNVVHRDLKPDNVLFQGEMALLTDFGIAKVLDANTELTSAGMNPGTVRYFSPEQASDRAVDARTDIYALGVLLYEMLTGRVPIDADSAVHLMLRIATQPPAPLPKHLHVLQPVIDVLLAKDPAARLGSCTEVIAVLQAMEHNWTRYGELDLLTQGVVLTPWGGIRCEPQHDAATLLFRDAGQPVPLAARAAMVDAAPAHAPAPNPYVRAPAVAAHMDAGVAARAGLHAAEADRSDATVPDMDLAADMDADPRAFAVPAQAAVGAAAAACIALALTAFVYLRTEAGVNPDGVDATPAGSAQAPVAAAAATMPGVMPVSAAQASVASALETTVPVDQREGVAVISRARPDPQGPRTRGRRDDGREPARYVPAAELAQGR